MTAVDLAFIACSLFGFIWAADNANGSKNWPTALLWAFLALLCVVSGITRLSEATA